MAGGADKPEERVVRPTASSRRRRAAPKNKRKTKKQKTVMVNEEVERDEDMQPINEEVVAEKTLNIEVEDAGNESTGNSPVENERNVDNKDQEEENLTWNDELDITGREDGGTPVSDRVSGLLGGMPTPRDPVVNREEDVDEETEQIALLNLCKMSSRPTIGGKSLSNMCPPKGWKGIGGEVVGDDGVDGNEVDDGVDGNDDFGEDIGDETAEVTDDGVEYVERASDNLWKLKTGVEGGPSNPELLRSFLAHVAYDIWRRKDRFLLKGVKSDDGKLDKWIPDLNKKKKKVGDLVRKTGLLHLKGLMYKHLDLALLTAFVERWHPETKSFHMPWGEVTMVLHDMAYLAKLPIVGKLPYNKETTETLRIKFGSLLGVPEHSKEWVKNWKSGCVKYSYIQLNMFRGEGNDDKVAKVYVMWLLSSTLFADKTKYGVMSDLVPYVEDLYKVGDYNWGAAALVNLYRQLGVASREKCASIAGCLTLLQIFYIGWIYAYFPYFRPKKQNDDWADGMPWLQKWVPEKMEPTKKELIKIRRELNDLTVDQVELTPFHPNPGNEHPISLFQGVLMFRHLKEPHMPDHVLRQFGYVQYILPTPYSAHEKECRYKPNAYICDYSFVPENYETFPNHCVHVDGLTKVTSGGECSPDYLEWFLERTHVKVMPETSSDNSQTVDEYLDRVVSILSAVHPSVPDEKMDQMVCVSAIDQICAELGPLFTAKGIGLEPRKNSGKGKRKE